VVGPLVVTATSADGDDESVDADTLRFVGRYVTIDSTSDWGPSPVTVLAKRVAKIFTRDQHNHR
jgi:hypothetical protein